MLSRDEICRLIPHRDPFLWIDEIVEESADRLVARKHLAADLDVFRGHYPGQPVMPGVLLCEAAMQAGAVLIARTLDRQISSGRVPVVTRMSNVKFRQMVRPQDTLEIEVELTDQLSEAYFLKARIKVAGNTVAQLEFACTLTEV
ncbi:MAG TPA: 3-hydroxyacyl-ACP dehydratase FabZ family protein [Planctomycetaceae bacterium]|nr:3-hydroxyacyl-ACP dehydratase FabZ family protein [Planctomycetaceae bacterium]